MGKKTVTFESVGLLVLCASMLVILTVAMTLFCVWLSDHLNIGWHW